MNIFFDHTSWCDRKLNFMLFDLFVDFLTLLFIVLFFFHIGLKLNISALFFGWAIIWKDHLYTSFTGISLSGRIQMANCFISTGKRYTSVVVRASRVKFLDTVHWVGSVPRETCAFNASAYFSSTNSDDILCFERRKKHYSKIHRYAERSLDRLTLYR